PALFGNLNDAVLSLAKIVPVGVDIDCLRIPAAQSDDGDRISTRYRTGPTLQTTESSARNQPGGRDGQRRGRPHCLGRSKERSQLRRIMRGEVFGQAANRLVFEEQRLGQ